MPFTLSEIYQNHLLAFPWSCLSVITESLSQSVILFEHCCAETGRICRSQGFDKETNVSYVLAVDVL